MEEGYKNINDNCVNNSNCIVTKYYSKDNPENILLEKLEKQSINKIDASQYYNKYRKCSERVQSSIYFLRSFNKFIKKLLINKSVLKLSCSEYSVLDLCCGKAGDFKSFYKTNAKLYVGADMSSVSLEMAKNRIKDIQDKENNLVNYSNLSSSTNKNSYNSNYKCKCYLFKQNISDPNEKLTDKIPNYIKFDLVSCQMALHYHFTSEINVKHFMQIVTEKLNYGGLFICSIIDDEILIKRLRDKKRLNNNNLNEELFKNINFDDNKNIKFEYNINANNKEKSNNDTKSTKIDNSYSSRNNELCFGNDYYSVKFENNYIDINNPYNIKYGFYLEDSIDARETDGQITYVEEYLIIFDLFVKICKDFDLHLIEKCNFIDYYNKMRKEKNNLELFKKFESKFNISKYTNQLVVSELYQVAVFQKGINNIKEEKIYTSVLENFKNEIVNNNSIEMLN